MPPIQRVGLEAILEADPIRARGVQAEVEIEDIPDHPRDLHLEAAFPRESKLIMQMYIYNFRHYTII